MNFTERLSIWINENGVKQNDIADRAGVTKGYVSNVATGKIPPSNLLLQTLSQMSGYSVHWWLYGKELTCDLSSLNELINSLISSGGIKEDGTYDEDIELIIKTMVNREIKLKLERKKNTLI